MNLKVQLICLGFSFVFGCFLYFIYYYCHHYIFKRRKVKRIIITSFIFFIESILYFLILKLLNDGILHLYFLLFIFCGFLVTYKIVKK